MTFMDFFSPLSYTISMLRADLHIHSSYSDGSDNLDELAVKIKKAGLDIIALTDHDTTDGVLEFEKLLPSNIKFIYGTELTCVTRGIKCHILGYNFNPKSEILHNLIEKGKILRRQKLETRINYLKDVWNIELTKEEKDWLYSRRSVVKTHLANILVNRGLANNNVGAMKKYIDGCKTGNTRFDGEEAISVILKSGGFPLWAHPLGGEGEVHLSSEEFLPKLKTLIDCGIKGLECYYSRYSKNEIEFLVKCANENNLLITGGSDYHGTNKDIPLGKQNIDNTPVEAEKLTLIKYLNLL